MSSIWYGPYGQGTGTITFAPQPPVRVVLNGIDTVGGLYKAAERVVELEEELKRAQEANGVLRARVDDFREENAKLDAAKAEAGNDELTQSLIKENERRAHRINELVYEKEQQGKELASLRNQLGTAKTDALNLRKLHNQDGVELASRAALIERLETGIETLKKSNELFKGSNDDLASTGHAMAAELEEERDKNHRLASSNKWLRQQVDERDERIAGLERANKARVQAIEEQLRKLL